MITMPMARLLFRDLGHPQRRKEMCWPEAKAGPTRTADILGLQQRSHQSAAKMNIYPDHLWSPVPRAPPGRGFYLL